MWPHPKPHKYHKATPVRCTECGVAFIYKHKPSTKNTFCSALCRTRWWIRNNRKHLSEYAKERRLLKPIFCRLCGAIIPRERRASGVVFCSDKCVLESTRAGNRKFRLKRRMRVLSLLGGAICIYCGCDEIGALEINHKNGGGAKEWRGGAGSRATSDIFYGRRPTDDLEVVCRVCNAWHYITRKTGVNKWTIIWAANSRVKVDKDND